MEKWLGEVFKSVLRANADRRRPPVRVSRRAKVVWRIRRTEARGLLQVAGIIEVVFGLMIAAGFFAGFAAFIAAGEMVVAYFKQHAPRGYSPMMSGGNGGELAILYLIIFLYIASVGSGSFSIDALIAKAKRR